MFQKILAALLALTLLAACEGSRSLDTLRLTEPQGDAYQLALASNYRDLAELRAIEYDWAHSDYFAEKGLRAARGQDVEPEDSAEWDIPAGTREAFVTARSKLMATIKENRSTQPELTASAVLAYDRWLMAQHSKWSANKINEQRDILSAILTKLEEAHVDMSAIAPSGEPASPVAKSSTTPDENSVVIYFPFDSDRIGDSAQSALAQLLRAVSDKKTVLSINGHADRAGTEEYNMRLSERRARHVMEALRHSGVAETMMRYYAFGETDPAIATDDGVPEPKNRRVEVFVE